MRALAQVALTQDKESDILLDSNVTGLILVNESLFSVQVSVAGINKWLPAWTADFFDFSDTPVSGGQASVIPRYYTTTTNPPSAILLPTAVYDGDTVSGTYPYPLTRQVNSNVTASSAYTLLAPDNQTFISLDDVDLPGSVGIFPSQSPTPTGLLDLFLAARINSYQIQPILETDVANLRATMKVKFGFELQAGINFYIAGMEVITGSGSGTFNHDLGVTPAIVLLSPTQVAENFSVGNYSPTQFTVGGIGVGHQWKALVIG